MKREDEEAERPLFLYTKVKRGLCQVLTGIRTVFTRLSPVKFVLMSDDFLRPFRADGKGRKVFLPNATKSVAI